MIVTTDIDVELMMVEFRDELPLVGRSGPLPNSRIRELVNGMPIVLDGKKFVLVLPQEKNPERFFFASELTDPETLETRAYIDGRSLMVLARYGQMIVDSLERDAPTDAAYVHVYPNTLVELQAAITNVKLAMEGVAIEVLGGG